MNICAVAISALSGRECGQGPHRTRIVTGFILVLMCRIGKHLRSMRRQRSSPCVSEALRRPSAIASPNPWGFRAFQKNPAGKTTGRNQLRHRASRTEPPCAAVAGCIVSYVVRHYLQRVSQQRHHSGLRLLRCGFPQLLPDAKILNTEGVQDGGLVLQVSSRTPTPARYRSGVLVRTHAAAPMTRLKWIAS